MNFENSGMCVFRKNAHFSIMLLSREEFFVSLSADTSVVGTTALLSLLTRLRSLSDDHYYDSETSNKIITANR